MQRRAGSNQLDRALNRTGRCALAPKVQRYRKGPAQQATHAVCQTRRAACQLKRKRKSACRAEQPMWQVRPMQEGSHGVPVSAMAAGSRVAPSSPLKAKMGANAALQDHGSCRQAPRRVVSGLS